MIRFIPIFAVAFFTWFCPAEAISQFRFQVGAGINIANEVHRIHRQTSYDVADTYFHNNVLKPAIALGAEYQFTTKISVSSSLYYLGMGYRTSDPDVGEPDDADYTYSNLLVGLNWYPANDLSLSCGPYIGYLLSASKNDNDIKDDRASIDWGIHFGAEILIIKNAGIGTKYLVGLNNTDNSFSSRFYNSYNRCLMLYVFYHFGK
jgi:hypothetical protein